MTPLSLLAPVSYLKKMPQNFTTEFQFLPHFVPSDACWNWCGQAQLAHQQNLAVGDLSLVAVALVALAANHIVYNYSQWIEKKTNLDSEQLETISMAASYFAFMLLAVFLIYITVFK